MFDGGSAADAMIAWVMHRMSDENKKVDTWQLVGVLKDGMEIQHVPSGRTVVIRVEVK